MYSLPSLHPRRARMHIFLCASCGCCQQLDLLHTLDTLYDARRHRIRSTRVCGSRFLGCQTTCDHAVTHMDPPKEAPSSPHSHAPHIPTLTTLDGAPHRMEAVADGSRFLGSHPLAHAPPKRAASHTLSPPHTARSATLALARTFSSRCQTHRCSGAPHYGALHSPTPSPSFLVLPHHPLPWLQAPHTIDVGFLGPCSIDLCSAKTCVEPPHAGLAPSILGAALYLSFCSSSLGSSVVPRSSPTHAEEALAA